MNDSGMGRRGETQHSAEQGCRLRTAAHQAAAAASTSARCAGEAKAGLCLPGQRLLETPRGESVRGVRRNGKGWERLKEGHAKFDSVSKMPGFAGGDAGLETVPGLEGGVGSRVRLSQLCVSVGLHQGGKDLPHASGLGLPSIRHCGVVCQRGGKGWKV